MIGDAINCTLQWKKLSVRQSNRKSGIQPHVQLTKRCAFFAHLYPTQRSILPCPFFAVCVPCTTPRAIIPFGAVLSIAFTIMLRVVHLLIDCRGPRGTHFGTRLFLFVVMAVVCFVLARTATESCHHGYPRKCTGFPGLT